MKMSDSGCGEEYIVIASFTTNLDDPNRTTWDLKPYQSAGLGTPGGTWRLIEAGAGMIYKSGKIAIDGTLVSNDYIAPSGVNLGGGGGSAGNGAGGSSSNASGGDSAGGGSGGSSTSGGSSGGSGGVSTPPPTPSGVPNSFTTTEHYEGYMQLQIRKPKKNCPTPDQKDCCK